jgi:ankyrin repeat protein
MINEFGVNRLSSHNHNIHVFHSITITTILVFVLACGNFACCATIHEAAQHGDIEKVKILLQSDPNLIFSKDRDGLTPLHSAVLGNQRNIVEMLLAKGVDVNAKDNHENSPLQYAVSKEIAELLLANGADVNARCDYRDWTPLQRAIAEGRNEVIDVLRQHGGVTTMLTHPLSSFTKVFFDASSTSVEKEKYLYKNYEGEITVSDILEDSQLHQLRIVVHKVPKLFILFYPTDLENEKLSKLKKGSRVHVICYLSNIYQTEYNDGTHETAEFQDTEIKQIAAERKP